MSYNLPAVTWNTLDWLAEQRDISNFSNRKSQIDKKVRKLNENKSINEEQICENVINLSKIEINEEELGVLCQGLKTCFSFSEKPEDEVLSTRARVPGTLVK